MNRLMIVLLVSFLLLLIDWYAFSGLKVAIQNLSLGLQKSIRITYWVIVGLTIAAFLYAFFGNPDAIGKHLRSFIMVWVFGHYLGKILMVLILLVEDISRLGRWLTNQFKAESTSSSSENAISRSEFLAKTAVVVAATPIVALSWGIISGAHDYRVRKIKLPLPNLPRAFEGLTIVQVSDIHSGSFWNKTAVQGGVDTLMKLKPEMVFFTGDLVNNRAVEMSDWGNVFAQIKAPLGVFSVLGNHDYGDYVSWESAAQKQQNLADLKAIHKGMGWDLLLNEHRKIKLDGEELAVLGIENWSAKNRFPKYGSLSQAYQGTEDIPTKLLLSHDPSHWRAEVLSSYPDIDVMFAGHTHGMQFGVEIPGLKWSPVQYVYQEWGGLYQAAQQYLYVNRGFGYIGYPGRIGIPPEITQIELIRAS